LELEVLLVRGLIGNSGRTTLIGVVGHYSCRGQVDMAKYRDQATGQLLPGNASSTGARSLLENKKGPEGPYLC